MQAEASTGNRILPHLQFADIAQGTSCAGPTICLNAETLPDGWARLTPRQPLQPGEYVLMPVQRQPKPGVIVVYDFSSDPAASIARDAVVAGAPPASRHRQ